MRSTFIAAIAVATTITTSQSAFAVSDVVRAACRADYLSHCQQHKVDTPELKACMRALGLKLSSDCMAALIQAGELSPDDIAKYRAAKAQ